MMRGPGVSLANQIMGGAYVCGLVGKCPTLDISQDDDSNDSLGPCCIIF
jgi:hypothetical protein